MRERVAGVLWVIVAAVAFSAAHQSAPPPPSPAIQPLKPGPAIILGKVVEAGTTSGVAGAFVSLDGPALGSPALTFSNGVPGGWRTVIADGQGQFVFRDLPAGSYTLSSRSAGYVDGEYGRRSVSPIRGPLDVRRALELADSDRPATVTIQMWKRGGIIGTVTDEKGEPVVDVPITVLARMVDAGGPTLQPVQFMTTFMTDDRGRYHADVIPGDYVIGLIAPTTTVPAAMVDRFLGAQREGGEIQQRFLADVQRNGSVLSRGFGVRIGDFIVSQMPQNTPIVPPFTGEDGRMWFYTSSYHPASSSIGTAAVVTVGSGEEKSGVDIRLRSAPVRRVSGRVVGPAGPVSGLGVRLYAADATVWRTAPARNFDTPQAVTDGSGAFTFVGVAPGSYTLCALQSAATGTSDPLLWVAQTVAVGEDDVTDLAVTLQVGATVDARLVIDGNGPPPDPQVLRPAVLALAPVPGSVAAVNWASARAPIDATNRFRTLQVLPGPYVVSLVNPRAAGWVVKSIAVNGRDAFERPIDIAASGANDIVITITDQIATLTGTARDGNGQTVPSATVVVFAADRALWPVPGMTSARLQAAAVDRAGRYTLRGMPPGEYCVAAIDGSGADLSDPKVLASLMSTAPHVTLGEGDARSQDVLVTVVR